MVQKEFVLEKLRTFRYKKIAVKQNPKEPSGYLCYLYIGKNFQQISKRITGFEGGYFFEDFTSALKILSLVDKPESLPDVIVFEGTHSQKEINSFLVAIRRKHFSNRIFTIAEVSGCSRQQIDLLKHSRLIDDLIILDTPGDALNVKVKFLKKIRSEKDPVSLSRKLETGTTKGNLIDSYFKRIFDIVVSATLLAILSPVLLFIAIAIKFESKGSVFYISPRAGKGYRVFSFFKFRTMETGADLKVAQMLHLNQYNISNNQPVFFKVNKDPRITKLGGFLRNTSLDELPQLVNVFLGDMSLVGNRPLPLYEASSLTTNQFATRFMAPAGMTGLWQIKKRGDANISVDERIKLDIDYANKCNFVYDLWIIANTPTALLQKTNV